MSSCIICKNETPIQKRPRLTCSKKCYYALLAKKNFANETRNMKISLGKLGAKNPIWKGDKVGYSALHAWIRRNYPVLKSCENCSVSNTWYGYLDLANVSGKYLRNRSDWKYLCRKCHMTSDDRLKRLRAASEGVIRPKREISGNWKGNSAIPASKRVWLKNNYGNPAKCSMCGILGKKYRDSLWSIMWCIKKGHQYSHEKEDYLHLCRTCHREYNWPSGHIAWVGVEKV